MTTATFYEIWGLIDRKLVFVVNLHEINRVNFGRDRLHPRIDTGLVFGRNFDLIEREAQQTSFAHGELHEFFLVVGKKNEDHLNRLDNFPLEVDGVFFV